MTLTEYRNHILLTPNATVLPEKALAELKAGLQRR